MILSASRRTDLPNYYVNWLIHRLQEGFVLVRNPMNPHQISRIPLSPSVVDCIVFWTKNPENMLSRLGDLSAFPVYTDQLWPGYRTIPTQQKRLFDSCLSIARCSHWEGPNGLAVRSHSFKYAVYSLLSPGRFCTDCRASARMYRKSCYQLC